MNKGRREKLERTHEALPRLYIPLYTATAHKHPRTFKWTVYIVNTTNSRVREELADVDGEVVGGTVTKVACRVDGTVLGGGRRAEHT